MVGHILGLSKGCDGAFEVSRVDAAGDHWFQRGIGGRVNAGLNP
jgi:hypothetical protein